MKRSYHTEDKEPESNFKIPAEGEYLFQVTDVNPVVEPDGENQDIQVAKIEIIGGEFEGISILNRCNLLQDEKSFYFTRMFLKAIGEPYKGDFDIEPDRWIGRQFYASVKHTKSKDGTKTYANIDQYNFEKKVEQVFQAKNPDNVTKPEEIAW